MGVVLKMTAKIGIYDGDTHVGDLLVDDEDYDYVKDYEWFLDGHNKPYRRIIRDDGRYTTQYLSRDVFRMKVGDARTVHYRDTSNYLDNRRENLKINKERINRRTLKSERGHLWPYTLNAFRSFIENRPELEFQKNKTTRIAVLNMLDNALSIVWKIKKLEFSYELGSNEYKSAISEANQSMFRRILEYYFDWNGILSITGIRVKTPQVANPPEPSKNPPKKKAQKEATEPEATETQSNQEDENEEDAYLPIVNPKSERYKKMNNITPARYAIPLPRPDGNLSEVSSKTLMRELLDRTDANEVVKDILPIATLDILIREVKSRMNCEIKF
jgi:hypothetical protein